MRILLDECVPRRLRRELVGLDVITVAEMGWAGKKNGELMQLMTTHGFDVLLTVDQNIPHQQNIHGAAIGVVVLVATSNRLSELLPLMPSVRIALGSIKPGQVIEIAS